MKKILLCLMALTMACSMFAGCGKSAAEDKKITTKADLEGKIVALQTDSSAEAALSADEISSKIKEIVKFPDNIAALNDLKAGRVDAVVLDEVVASYYAAKDPSTFLVLEDSLAAEEYGIAFKKGNEELFNKVNAALAIMSDGAASKISDKWFGKDIFLKNFLTEHTAETLAAENPPSGKKLVVGLDDSFPPMGFRNDKNEIVGFDIDLAREVARLIGYEVVLQPIDWASKELELESGNIDCIWNALTITPDRKETMLLTEPYLANNQVIVVKP